MVTRKEVASLAGVSVAVVSYVMNGNGKVAETTRERVLNAMRELDYRPNTAARSLKTGKTYQIAVVVNDLGNPFEAELLAHLEAAADGYGYALIVRTYRRDEELGLSASAIGRADGVILFGQSVQDATWEAFRKARLPVLSIMRPVWDRKGLPVIDMDWTQEMRKLLAHLSRRGVRSVGFMGHGDPSHPHTQRFQGFLQAVPFSGLRYEHDYLLHGGGDFYRAREAMTAKIASGLPFQAIVCASDVMAAGAVSACREAGIPVPDRLAVVGCENVVLSAASVPSLSTVHYPKEELAALAIVTLLNAMRGKAVGGFTFEGELVARESTAGIGE